MRYFDELLYPMRTSCFFSYLAVRLATCHKTFGHKVCDYEDFLAVLAETVSEDSPLPPKHIHCVKRPLFWLVNRWFCCTMFQTWISFRISTKQNFQDIMLHLPFIAFLLHQFFLAAAVTCEFSTLLQLQQICPNMYIYSKFGGYYGKPMLIIVLKK